MNKRSVENLYRMILNGVFLASLPDSEKHKLWENARKLNPDNPMLSYFDYFLEGPPGTRGIFENLHLEF
ncbi:MAG: hypothetical protein FWG27_04615 [Treponema sp.]|nr:hypothetical protein [Treponema sp.]